ncbi:MAG: 2-C-methyl-D-erythritol 4-phosphate cytidylyltransferase, partial [Clostridia bacterium]|nr:2-C-methyl-D-erythritol 4-phosphate cytidylyltransferase [Clostridia bacterium]
NKVTKVVMGGKTRLESVYNAMLACSSKADYVLVHDAARPFIEKEDIRRVYEMTKRYGCAAAGRRMTDTVKTLEGERIVSTLDRNTLAAVQTPQGADRSLLFAALKKAVDGNDPLVTDESSALEKIGAKPYLVECSPLNIKITANEDVFLAKALTEMRKDKCE